MTTRTLLVPDISCGHCQATIESAITPIEGVSSAAVSVDERTVVLDFDGEDATFAAVVEAMQVHGYEVAW